MFLRCDSFDNYAVTADLTDRGYVNDSPTKVNFHATNGRFGGGCLEITDDDLGLRLPISPAGATPQTVFFSASLKTTAWSPGSDFLLDCWDSTGINNIRIRMGTNGLLSAYEGSTFVRGVSSQAVPIDEWFRLELRLKPGPASVGRVEMLFDGVSVMDVTADFAFSGSEDIAGIELMGNVGATVTWDDVVILDDQGASMNDHLGDLKIEALAPTVDTAQQDFTASNAGDNFAEVDDTAADGDAGYNHSNSVNDEDLFTHGDLSGDPQTVHGVVVNLMAKDTGVNRGLKASAKSVATTSRGSEITLTGGYKMVQSIFETDPDTAAAWDGAGVDAAEFGYQVSS